MKIKIAGEMVDVASDDCKAMPCLWIRRDPGSYSQGRGYSQRGSDLICGTRAIHGCPVQAEQPVSYSLEGDIHTWTTKEE